MTHYRSIFDGGLPERVTFLDNMTLGNHSGNPTPPAIYGFRRDVLDDAPKFAIIQVLDDQTSFVGRRVCGLGPLKESEFNMGFGLLKENINSGPDDLIAEFDNLQGGIVEVRINVPGQRTSELVVKHALHIIYNKG